MVENTATQREVDAPSPFVKMATEAEMASRRRANSARDRVSMLRTQLADAEREMAEAIRDSEYDQKFLRDVWDHFRSSASAGTRDT